MDGRRANGKGRLPPGCWRVPDPLTFILVYHFVSTSTADVDVAAAPRGWGRMKGARVDQNPGHFGLLSLTPWATRVLTRH